MYLPQKTYWYDQYGYTTVKEHIPESHLAYEHNRAQNAATLIPQFGLSSHAFRDIAFRVIGHSSFPKAVDSL